MYKKSLSDKSQNVMKSAGQMLREKREELAVTPREVADAIKVREKYVTALEADDYSVFSSPVYLKGFLKNYAKFLGMNPDNVVAIYRRDSLEKRQQNMSVNETELAKKAFVLTPQMVISVLVVIFIVGVLGYFINQFYQLNRPPELTVTSPKDGATIQENMVTVKGDTVPDADLTVNGEAVKVNSEGKFETTVALEDGENTIVVKSRDSSNIGGEATVKIQVFYEKPGSPTTETPGETPAEQPTEEPEEKPPVASDGLKASVEISPENAWIELIIDGKKELARIVQAGEKVEVTGEETIEIVTGKMSSTKFTVNGVLQSFEGQSGVGRLECVLDKTEDAGFKCDLPE
jgi:cytoskeletal protein RodZ